MNNNLRNLLKQKLDAKISVGHPVLGIMGNTAGVVEVPDRPGYVYVRINDTLAEVPNKRCAAQPGVEVWVGIDPIESNITQVLDYRASAIGTQTDYANLLKIHGKEHTWGGNDPAPIWGMQILDGRVTAYQALSIIVYPVMVLIPGTGYVNVAEMTPKDLTAYVPATAGYWVWVLVTVNLSGAIVYTAGTPVLQASFGLDDIPTEPTDTIRVLGAVRLYNGQTNLYETINGSDILDLRGSSIDHSSLYGLQGGIDGEYYHLTKAELGRILPVGVTTGDMIRYNSVSGAWETTSEPAQFKGIVLTPALAALVDIEGAIYYKSDTKAVMVCTSI